MHVGMCFNLADLYRLPGSAYPAAFAAQGGIGKAPKNAIAKTGWSREGTARPTYHSLGRVLKRGTPISRRSLLSMKEDLKRVKAVLREKTRRFAGLETRNPLEPRSNEPWLCKRVS